MPYLFLAIGLAEKSMKDLSNKKCDKSLQKLKKDNYIKNQNVNELYKDDQIQKSFLWEEWVHRGK